MKKIVILKGSPRKNGNSSTLADVCIEYLKKQGTDTIVYELNDKKISGCKACNACIKKKDCIYKDDFQEVNNEILSADGFIITTPLYWYAFPTQIKALIDRWYSVSMAGKDFRGKKTAIIGCCEDNTIKAFDGVKLSFEKTMAILKADIVDELYFCSVNDVGEIYNTDAIEKTKKFIEKYLVEINN